MTLLTKTDELAELCDELAQRSRSSPLDTEFMRDRTYFPKLCLVQVAGERRHAAIDPLAQGLDLAPLLRPDGRSCGAQGVPCRPPGHRDLPSPDRRDPDAAVRHPARRHGLRLRRGGRLRDPGRTARQGADRQELALHRLVAPAARPSSSSTMRWPTSSICAWSTRSSRQQLRQTGRSEWVAQELAELTDPPTYDQPPEEAWRRIKLRSREPRFLAIVQALAAWREREAQRARPAAQPHPARRPAARGRRQPADARPTTSPSSGGSASTARAPAAVVEAVRAALDAAEAVLPAARAAAQAAARPRPDDRPPARAAQAPVRGARRRPAAGRDHRRPRGDRRRRRAGRRRAASGWRYEVFGRAALALKRGELGARRSQSGRLALVPMRDLVEPA